MQFFTELTQLGLYSALGVLLYTQYKTVSRSEDVPTDSNEEETYLA